ncbi:MAG: VCBS repeat-containing protein [Bryobacteraceae bacterium]|nr:VCBS repeat-containing protein [Bryobacteraceae bacterium]
MIAALTLALLGLAPGQEIATGLNVVYAVTTADVNGDGKLDIVLINNTQLMWFQNPTWEKHVVVEKVTEKDNVALSATDIDGDGKLDFALGADWQATNTKGGGSLHWVSSTGKVTDITTEPTIHRIRWADITGDGKPELIVVPLHGKGTSGPAWTDGPGARILVYTVPKNPATEPWPVEVADGSLHIVHNFITVGREIWAASTEGVHALAKGKDGKWTKRLIAQGQPGEIKLGTVAKTRWLATVEPWHGNKVVVYEESKAGPWKRTEIETGLNQAHALAWADFDGDGSDELIAGWRNKPWGIAMYKRSASGEWKKSPVDDGVAVEDLTIADLNGDGKPDLIAGGRATGNLRIYWGSGAN